MQKESYLLFLTTADLPENTATNNPTLREFPANSAAMETECPCPCHQQQIAQQHFPYFPVEILTLALFIKLVGKHFSLAIKSLFTQLTPMCTCKQTLSFVPLIHILSLNSLIPNLSTLKWQKKRFPPNTTQASKITLLTKT